MVAFFFFLHIADTAIARYCAILLDSVTHASLVVGWFCAEEMKEKKVKGTGEGCERVEDKLCLSTAVFLRLFFTLGAPCMTPSIYYFSLAFLPHCFPSLRRPFFCSGHLGLLAPLSLFWVSLSSQPLTNLLPCPPQHSLSVHLVLRV